MVEGYCVRCKKKVEMKNPEEVINKRGGKMAKGTCPNCSTKVNCFLKKT